VTPKNVKQIILQFLRNPDNFAKLRELQMDDLKKLTLISSVNSLKTVHQVWVANKDNSREAFWQDFFKDNSWVISYVFSFPVVLFKDKAYVGGKTLDNKGGEIIDFIYKHHFTENVLLVEIKTPTVKLLGSEYRNGIFSMSQDLSGAVSQILDYKNEILNSYADLIRKAGKTFAVFNPRCMIVAGNIMNELNSDNKRKSFELHRNDSRQIDIVGFDELFQKVEYLVQILEK
ncbi:MAG: Shedu immune nuclease family protein, partial [Candidatus Omnitrophota bacterium]